MADASTTDPADQDPISQTVTTQNALNFKNFVDTQLQLNQLMLSNAIHNQNELNKYSMQALARSENINNASTAVITAAAAKSVQAMLDPTSAALADSVMGDQASKVADNTPPVYQDPTNGTTGANGASAIALISQLVAALTGKGSVAG